MVYQTKSCIFPITCHNMQNIGGREQQHELKQFRPSGISLLQTFDSHAIKSCLSCTSCAVILPISLQGEWYPKPALSSGVAMAFQGGRLAHSEGQNEEENEKSLRKSKKIWSKFEEKMRKVKLLPTRDCKAGYDPGTISKLSNGGGGEIK